jgi:hypothetical protein
MAGQFCVQLPGKPGMLKYNKIDSSGLFDDPGNRWGTIPDQLLNTPAVARVRPPSTPDPDQDASGGGSGNSSKGGHSTTTTTTDGTTTTTTTTTTTSTAPSSLVINVAWDSSVSSAPSGFTAAVMRAVQYLESRFSDPVIVNIKVGYGEVAGTALSSGELGESRWSLISQSYSQLLNVLKADGKTASDSAAAASLPASSPVSGTFWTTTAQGKALGLLSPTGSAVDGSVGFSQSMAFDYDNSNGVTSGTYDFEAIVLHEITEVLGRSLLTGTTIGGASPSYSIGDLFHYSSAGVRDFSAAKAGYFSINGGTTNLDPYNIQSGGDAGDWASAAGHDAFNAFSSSGVINSISDADLTALDVIGWDRTAASGLSAPTGVTLSPVTTSLGSLSTTSGLAANKQIVSAMQTGGYSIDNCAYTLGGSGAASFTLSASNGPATLTTSAAGVPGALNGLLYQLNATATDTTNGLSSPAAPIDVIVGSSTSDTINVATLVGAGQGATPSFIYGLAGSDVIDASGMTGAIWIDAGGGADVLSGGSGTNDYLFGAAGDSSNSAMDIIMNFSAANDLIDLTGLGKLAYVGAIAGTTLGAQSVGWQQSGGNTFIYVDNTTSSQALGSTSMRIELQGAMTLSSANILHH